MSDPIVGKNGNIKFVSEPRMDSYYRVVQGSPTEEALRQKVLELTETVIKQDTILRTLASPPFIHMTVVAQGRPASQSQGPVGPVENPATVIIGAGGQELEVPKPTNLDLKVGMVVRVNPKSMSIVDIVEASSPPGTIMTIAGILSPETAEIDVGTSRKTIATNGLKVERGDRVLTDLAMGHILKNLGKQTDDFQADTSRINVTWDSIGGQKLAKQEMQEAIEGPIKNREIFEAYGKKPVKGILLYGPPGTGKTLLAKAAATSIASLYGKKATTGFIYVKGPEILNKWVGQSEETIRNLFSRARDHYRREGYPAVLFIDEADAILGARGTSSIVSGMERTIVPMFLAEMDGLDEDGPLVLLATNRSDSLDPAIVRDGRVDRKIEVSRPNKDDAAAIFAMYLRGKPFADVVVNGQSQAITRDAFAEAFAEAVFASPLKLRVCGALISGLVDQAVSLAMRRDIAQGLNKPSGLTMDDIKAAVAAVESQNLKVQNG